ncbi:MAG: cysteine hydrolase family protein [Phycicoccus sp.]
MTTALIVIDVQESFREMPEWADVDPPDIVARVGRLVAHAREVGDLVIWVLHSEPGSSGPFDPDLGFVRLQHGLERRPDETMVTKTSHNAFTTTDLENRLESYGATRLRICGIRTEQCVETTARLASDLGYDVEVVIDATATHPLRRYDGDGVIAPDEVVARTAAALSGRFATIATVDGVVTR